MKRNTPHPAASATDTDAEALRPGEPAADREALDRQAEARVEAMLDRAPVLGLLSETLPAHFGLRPDADDFLFSVRPGQPTGLALSEAQTLLSAVSRRLREPMLERLGGDEAYLLGFAVDAAGALYHSAGASE